MGVVVGGHGQREAHVLDEKFLGGGLAAVVADAGASGFLQNLAPLDENSLVLHDFPIDLNVVDLPFSHQPLTSHWFLFHTIGNIPLERVWQKEWQTDPEANSGRRKTL